MRQLFLSLCLLIVFSPATFASVMQERISSFTADSQTSMFQPPPLVLETIGTFDQEVTLQRETNAQTEITMPSLAVTPLGGNQYTETKIHTSPLAQNFNFAFMLKGGLAATIA